MNRSLLLSAFPFLGLCICSPVAHAAVISSLSSQFVTASAPTNYAVFVGASHDGWRFDLNALAMAKSYVNAADKFKTGAVATVIMGDVNTDPIRTTDLFQVFSSINDPVYPFKTHMKPGDSFTLYINNHGGSTTSLSEPFNGKGVGDEYVRIGDDLRDDHLASSLFFHFRGFQKTVFLDVCHGGGFWGGTDFTELQYTGDVEGSNIVNFRDLSLLDDIALYAAASETKLGYADFLTTGLGFWGKALIDSFDKNLNARELAKFLDDQTQKNAGWFKTWWNGIDPVWYETGLGDPVFPDLALIEPFHASSSDYDMERPMFLSVPEPGILSLMALGLAGIGYARRKQLN